MHCRRRRERDRRLPFCKSSPAPPDLEATAPGTARVAMVDSYSTDLVQPINRSTSFRSRNSPRCRRSGLVARQSVHSWNCCRAQFVLSTFHEYSTRRCAMRAKGLFPLLAAGIALSGSAFGATATNVNSGTTKANTYSSNTQRPPPRAQAGVQQRLVLRGGPEVNNFGGSPAMVPKGD
jgi:hypothetical protein